jgi:pimeloyl-ACP methyl ester carboxylesterase
MGGFGLTIALALAGFLTALLLAGALYQEIGMRRDARRFPAPGRRINIGPARLNVEVSGAGSSVIFEAGIAATSLSWRLIQPEVAKYAQALSYDRAGLGWSDTIAETRDVWRLVDELRTMLDRAGIAKPRVLVAHSFGGLIAVAYALRFPDELAGMVLVDPAGTEEWANPDAHGRAMLRRGIVLARFGEALARVGVVRFTLDLLSAGARTVPKLIARASSGRGGTNFMERMVGQIRKLPADAWPMIQAHWSDPKCFRSAASQLAALPASAAEILKLLDSATITAPFILLSAGDASPAQRSAHERLVERFPSGKLQIVENCGHWIMLDRPEVVLQAIREISRVR